MAKKRAAKPKKEMVSLDLESLSGYRLILQRAKPKETQLSFAEFTTGWSALPDPILAMQHDRLAAEIGELNCRTGIIFIDRGIKHQDNGAGTLVVVEDDEAHIIFPPQFDKKGARKHLREIMKVILTIEDVLGFKTYDPQLGREVDIRADLSVIRANWRQYATSEDGLI